MHQRSATLAAPHKSRFPAKVDRKARGEQAALQRKAATHSRHARRQLSASAWLPYLATRESNDVMRSSITRRLRNSAITCKQPCAHLRLRT